MEAIQAILVVRLGTSYNDSREKTIGAVERAVAEAFPAYEVRRAFTSQRIIDKLKKRDQRSIDNLKEALDRAAADGIKSLIVQPTHLMDGFEYMDVKAEVEANQGRFERLALGAPLLASEADLDAVIRAMAGELGGYDDGKTALCLMGHGTDAASNQVYQKMQDRMIAVGYANYYIGTVEAQPDLQAVIEKLGAQKHYQRAVLQPLMVVAGDHANQDMAGEEEDSWKSQFVASGNFESVDCQIAGLGEIDAIQQIYVAHTKAAIDSLGDIATTASADSDVLADGTYSAKFDTDSSMFHVNEAYDGRGTLTVKNGKMTLHIVMPSQNIVNLFLGTAEDAQKDGAKLIQPTTEEVTYSDGSKEEVYAFDVPVEALDQEFDLALIGTKGKWYDHKVSVSDAKAE